MPKFLGSFRDCKSANFCSVQASKSQIRKFSMINPKIADQLIAIFTEGPQIYKKNIKSANLRIGGT